MTKANHDLLAVMQASESDPIRIAWAIDEAVRIGKPESLASIRERGPSLDDLSPSERKRLDVHHIRRRKEEPMNPFEFANVLSQLRPMTNRGLRLARFGY